MTDNAGSGATAELLLLIDEYDPQNSDWGFRKGVIKNVIARAIPDAAQARIRELEQQVNGARDALALADKMISEHIEKFHDFDYEPHQVPAELADLRQIEHHLMGSLILDEDIAALTSSARPIPEKENSNHDR